MWLCLVRAAISTRSDSSENFDATFHNLMDACYCLHIGVSIDQYSPKEVNGEWEMCQGRIGIVLTVYVAVL